MRARTQRTPKYTNTPWQKACILGAFRLLHRSKRRASSRCEQSIIYIRPVVTAAEIMLPSARAPRGPLLPIPFRVTEEHRHHHANLTWNLRLERFGIRTPHIPFLEHGTPITGFHFVSACKDFGHENQPFQDSTLQRLSCNKKMLGCFAPISHSYYIDRPDESY